MLEVSLYSRLLSTGTDTCCSFAILHGPTDLERTLMETWIEDLVRFVNDDREYDYGT